MPSTSLGSNWTRHYKNGSAKNSAYLVSHGSYQDSYGFTELPSPSNIHFYTFHTHSMYTVEIFQVLNYKDRVKFGDNVVNCKRKIATSIMGAGSKCWNYYLSAWDKTKYNEMVKNWSNGGNDNEDLLIMEAGPGGVTEFIMGGNNCKLNDLFTVLKANNLTYPTIQFLCCRSDETATQRPEPPSTAPLYQSSNPYWPGL